MTALEKVRSWIAAFPGFDILGSFQVDYTDHVNPGPGSIFPGGLVEIERRRDVVGAETVVNQYNFGIYCVLEKAGGATVNTDWVMEFREWVQTQSMMGQVPSFGDEPRNEKITAQNGSLYDTSEGVETYMIQLSIQFIKKFEEENKWLT